MNQINLNAWQVGLLDLRDFYRLNVFDVGYVNFGDTNGEYIGMERPNNGQLLINQVTARSRLGKLNVVENRDERDRTRLLTQFLDAEQGMAVDTAVSRGRFELNCSAVTPTVLSRDVYVSTPSVKSSLRLAAEYTIGVSGCGYRKTFLIICPDGSTGCFECTGYPCF